ncbi:hypothetical protein V7S43_002820 [Phytophthora oleae]|uniref:GRIP domain-containing protein n=1 Tax=Phytophthora oleae TaxID=2107226 RepID=A0ABD3G1Q8_9STRA
MWTVLFGDNEDGTNPQPSGVPSKTSAAPSPQHSTPPVTPSPLEPPTPSTPPPRRISEPKDTKGQAGDDTPMSMLLKRLNNLMIKVGEHEFEKKTLVDQMEKERKLLSVKINELEKQIEDLKDQNVQLQYKIEYTSEPMLMERVQDITDMRDALAAVKKQLEAELQEKDKDLKDLKTALALKDKELSALREEYETQIETLTMEREAAKQEAADAVRVASDAASEKYEQQLKEKEATLQTTSEEKEILETTLAEKERALDEAENAKVEMQRSLEEVQAHSEADAKALEQLRLELEQAATEHEQKLQQLMNEDQEKFEALEKHVQEQEAIAAEKTQELEDYKHDCVELWKNNEELKQQIALTSAETMLKHAELRENALSGQTVLEDKVTELENQLEELQEQLNRKTQEIAELQAEAESHNMVDGEASGEDDDKFVVVGGDGGAISILTEQVATAQRELTEAMELNLHLNNRNAWLEEQYQMLSSVQSEGDDDADVKLSPEERIAALEQELQEACRAANEKAEHVSNLEQNYSALSTEFDRLHSAHNELVEVKQADDAMLNDLKNEVESLHASQATASDKDQALYAKDQELAELRSSNSTLSIRGERLNGLEGQLQQTHDALIQAQNELAEAQAINARMQHELEELRGINAAASKSDEHVTAIQNELAQVRSEKDSFATELTQSQAFIHDLQLKIQELEGIVNGQMNDKQSLEQQLQNLQEMAQENMEGSYEVQTNLESTMEELEKTRAQLRAEQEKCVSLQQSVEDAKQSSIPREELDRALGEIASLDEMVRHFRGLEQSLKQQLQDAVRSREAVAFELQCTQSERVAVEEEQKRLKASYEQAVVQLASTGELQRTNDDLSRSLEQTRAKLMQAEQQINTMRAEHGEAQKQVEALTKKNLSLVSEVQSMRDQVDNQQQMARGQLEQLTAAHADIQRQLAEATHALQDKDAEVQRNVSQLEEVINRYKTDKHSSDQQLAQLKAEYEHLRLAHDDTKATVQRAHHEVEQIRAQQNAAQQEKSSLEAEVAQLRGLSDEKAHLLQEIDEQKRVNQRLEETSRELEGLLQKSKAYCEELSRDSEDKVSRMQEFASHVEQEARDEINRIAHENGVLRDELEQLAQARFEETNAHDELRVKVAEMQAENNVLSARAHRLTQQLSQYTVLPEDDELSAGGQGQTPDLWELLSSGMEQLKADLELASKYAASIDASSVDGGIGDESFTVAN